MLRYYQSLAVHQIRELYKSGAKKVLLYAATGSGKTVIFSYIVKSVYENGKHAIVLVRGRKLVDQASKRLEREGVPHGVYMAGHKKYHPNEPIQVCSIDTVISRKIKPKADIIVIDEADQAGSKGYVDFLAQYPDAYMLPVTATPYTEKPLRHMAQAVVYPISIKDLISQGYLVKPRYFCPYIPDLKGVKTKTTSDGNDYNTFDLERVMGNAAVLGDIAKHWLSIAKGRPTLCFCASVAHSKRTAEHLVNHGVRAIHIDADSSDDERLVAISKLENGEIDVICNVGILGRGVDIPKVSCVIMARPTKSLNLFIQQAGRGTRTSDGKSDFIILDHSGNVMRHGFITDEHEVNLDGRVKQTKKIMSPTQCLECFAVFIGAVCPECGNQNEKKRRQFSVADGTLKEITENDKIRDEIAKLKVICKTNGYKRGWVYYQIKDKYGQDVADEYFPRNRLPWWIERSPQ